MISAKFIEPFRVMAILARSRELEAQGRSIIHMEIGEPDFPTPQPILDAGIRALEKGDVHYAQAAGIPELREAIAEFYGNRYRIRIAPSRVIVTPGASGALALVLAAITGSGDHVLVTDPGYPCHRHVVAVMGGVAIGVPLEAEARYELNEELLARHWSDRSLGLILASPANPTGALQPDETLNAIIEALRVRGGVLISDEIYHGLTYERDAQTALAYSDEVFVINSFSKYFHMTGWRLGWLIAPPQYVSVLESLAQNLFLASSTLAQRAALAAFLPETLSILEARREELRSRRDALVPALGGLGFDIRAIPHGAFYVYAGCGRFTCDSGTFCDRLLEDAGVAITPGADFGRFRAKEHVRFAYTATTGRLMEGVRRIGQFTGNTASV